MAGRSARTINSLGGGLLLLAVILGSVYAFWVVSWSGEEVARLPLESADDAKPDGYLGPVALTPGMSPVRALIDLDYESWNFANTAIGYTAEAVDADGDRLWRMEGRIDSRDSGDNTGEDQGATVNLRAFEVPASGDYYVGLDIGMAGPADLTGADLVLRANAATFDVRIVGALAALALLGVWLGQRGRGRERG